MCRSTMVRASGNSAVAAAREGRLDPAGVETVGAALARLEAALRARAHYTP